MPERLRPVKEIQLRDILVSRKPGLERRGGRQNCRLLARPLAVQGPPCTSAGPPVRRRCWGTFSCALRVRTPASPKSGALPQIDDPRFPSLGSRTSSRREGPCPPRIGFVELALEHSGPPHVQGGHIPGPHSGCLKLQMVANRIHTVFCPIQNIPLIEFN